MDYQYVSSRTRALKKELEEIGDHNRKYFARRRHTAIDISRHREIQERVIQIRAELSTFMKDRVA
jgi:hypothetical protein